MERIVGIDLGTSTSCLALIKDGEPVVVPDSRGTRVTPSYIHVLEDGKILVGLQAKVEVISDPYSTIWATKRLIGRRYDDPEVQNAKKYFGFDILAAPDGTVRVKGRDKILSPTEIGAIILKYLTRIGKRYTGEEIKKVVITVPAYFTDPQRKATREAGTMIGLDVVRLLNEPTAAALAYGYDQDTEQTIAIYDLGGGTFDLSVLAMGQGVFEVVATEGDSYLGGEDFDNRLVDFLAADLKKKFSIDLFNDKMAHQRVKDAAERAKVALSSKDEVEINLPSICPDVNRWAGIETVITRKQYEGMIADLVDRTIIIFDRLLKSVAMSKKDIDNLILVGGMTRMPIVRRKVAEFFGREPDTSLNPDEAVAIGAAIHAASLTGEKLLKKRRLVDAAKTTAPAAADRTRPGIDQGATRPGVSAEATKPGVAAEATRPGADPGATRPAWSEIDQGKTKPGMKTAPAKIKESPVPAPAFVPPKPPPPPSPPVAPKPPPTPPAGARPAPADAGFDSKELPLDPSQLDMTLPAERTAPASPRPPKPAAAPPAEVPPLGPAPTLEDVEPIEEPAPEPAAGTSTLYAGFDDFFFGNNDEPGQPAAPVASSPVIVGGAAASAPAPVPAPAPGDEFSADEPEPPALAEPAPADAPEPEPIAEPEPVPEPEPLAAEIPNPLEPIAACDEPPFEPTVTPGPEPALAAPPPFPEVEDEMPIELDGDDLDPTLPVEKRPDLAATTAPDLPPPPRDYDDQPQSAGPIVRDEPAPAAPRLTPSPRPAEPEPEYVSAPVLLDVLSQSVGIGHFGGHFVPLIRRFAKLPARATQVFTTCTDNQERIRISVLQGESKYQKENTPLGEFVLDGIERGRRGVAVIEVSFDIDQSGLFTVSARDQHTGVAKEVRIEGFTGGRSGPAEAGQQV